MRAARCSREHKGPEKMAEACGKSEKEGEGVEGRGGEGTERNRYRQAQTDTEQGRHELREQGT
eukprot:127460-Hanusia_phi.AAC.1